MWPCTCNIFWYDPAHSHSAVDSAIYGIELDHNLAGIPSSSDSPIIHHVSRVAKTLIGTRLINKKEPILPDMIKKLAEASKLNNLLYLRNVCIFFLAFAGFSELRRFFTLSRVIILFTTLMLLSKLIEVRSDGSTKKG